MSAIRTTAFTIWPIAVVLAFEFGFTLPNKIDQLPASSNNYPAMFFVLIVVASFLYFVGIVRSRWESNAMPENLGFLEKLIERERIERFVMAVQPTKLLIACAAVIGCVGIARLRIRRRHPRHIFIPQFSWSPVRGN